MVVATHDVDMSAQAVAKKKTRRKTKKAPRRADPNEPIDENDENMGADNEPSGSGLSQNSEPEEEDDALMIDTEPAEVPLELGVPSFPPMSEAAQASAAGKKSETRRIPIPPHRMTPLKKDWINIFGPLTELLGLQVRMNVQRRSVEIRVCLHAVLSRASLWEPNLTSTHSDIKANEGDRRLAEGCRLCESVCARIRCERE